MEGKDEPEDQERNTPDPVRNLTGPTETAMSDAEKRLAERLLEIGRECAAHFKEPYRSIDHGDLLYDKNGLPK
jgi:hypothetical protein